MDCFLFSLEFFGRDNGTLIYLSTVRTSRCVCQCVEDYWETKGKSRHCPETAMYVISVSLASISVYLDAWLKKILFPIKRFSSPPSAQHFRNRKKLLQLDLRAILGRNPLACRVIFCEKKILTVSLAEWTYVLVPSAKKNNSLQEVLLSQHIKSKWLMTYGNSILSTVDVMICCPFLVLSLFEAEWRSWSLSVMLWRNLYPRGEYEGPSTTSGLMN